MKTINNNTSLTNFDFWSGAKDHEFTYNELNEIEVILEDLYPDGMEETQINDLFWFEEETLCEWIAIDYNEYLER
tara:strand:- start:44 stop:268 length:225 start_codon:yes stop_codon:yes gene_type:complete